MIKLSGGWLIRSEHEGKIREYLGEVASIDDLTLRCLMAQDPQIPNPQYMPHGEKVVATLLAEGEESLGDFIREWRQQFRYFVGENHCLPDHWSVWQRVKRDRCCV